MGRFATGISEIVLVVEDVQRAAEFYEDVVGLEPIGPSDDTWAWFFAGEPGTEQRVAVHRGTLLFEDQSPHPEGHRFGNVHYAFEVPAAKLEEAVEHVRSKGLEVYGPVEFEWMNATSYYFYDPDANLLEFWARNDS
jgi:catechol 2,3-dioxygenase-like lactoylglutathione lyase family enzyme